MAKEVTGELIVKKGFDYTEIKEASVVKQLQDAASRIREHMKRTVEDAIEIGRNLLEVKDSLKHGEFGAWLGAEFGFSDRQAEHYMSLAESWGSKIEVISNLPIQPTALIILSGKNVPEKARTCAVKYAEDGNRVTVRAAKEFVAKAKNKSIKAKRTKLSTTKLSSKLGAVLDKYKAMWNPKDIPKLARLLREFAKELTGAKRSAKKAKAAK